MGLAVHGGAQKIEIIGVTIVPRSGLSRRYLGSSWVFYNEGKGMKANL